MTRRAVRIGVPLDRTLSLVPEAPNRARLANGIVWRNCIFGVPGLYKLGSQLHGIPVKFLNFWDDSGVYHLVCLTTRELYEWGSSKWMLRTRIYTTGTVSCSGGKTVTGVGTSWQSDGIPDTGMIKLGTTDPNASGTWYEIDSVDSNTQLTLKENGPSVSGVDYVISMSFTVDFQNPSDGIDACIVEQPGKNYVVVGSNRDTMVKWGGVGQAEVMPGAEALGLKPRLLVSYKNRLIALAPTEGSTDYWHRYRWSTVNDFDDWTGTGSGFEDLIGGAGISRISGVDVEQSLIIYEEQDTYLVNYVGGTEVFRSTVASYKVGIAGKNAKIRLDDFTLGLSWDRLSAFRFGGYAPVVYDRVHSIFLSGEEDYDPNYAYTACGARFTVMDCGILSIPSTGGGSKRLLLVDKNGIPMAIWETESRVTAMEEFPVYTGGGTWDEDSEAWDDDTTKWDYLELVGSSKGVVLGSKDGDVYLTQWGVETSGTTTWESLPYVPNVATRVEEVRFHIKGESGGSVTFEYSVDYGTNWVSLGSQTLDGTIQELSWFPDKWCDSFKFRLTAPTDGLVIFMPVTFQIERRQR